MQRGRARIAVFVGLLGCGDDGVTSGGSSTTIGGSSTTEDGTSSTSSASSSGGSAPALPPACEGLSSPFVSAECLGGLRDRCGMAANEADCNATAPGVFDGGAYVIACGWAKVVGIADVDMCTIGSVVGRCEAGIEQDISCFDKCSDTPDLYASLRAIVADAELIEMPCTSDGGVLDGPIGPWSAIGATPGETGTCAPDIAPPAPPICTCAAEACAAE